MTEVPLDYEERYVAVLDILGFTSLVKKNASVFEIGGPLSRVHSYCLDIKEPIRAAMFSDTVVLTAPAENLHLERLLKRVHHIYGWLLHPRHDREQPGWLVRGGVARGKTYQSGSLLFGRGVVDAHELERDVAAYPRVVFAKEIVQEVVQLGRLGLCVHVREDSDGWTYLDSLRMAPSWYDPEADGPATRDVWLSRARDWLERELEGKSATVVSKYSWVVKKIDEALLA